MTSLTTRWRRTGPAFPPGRRTGIGRPHTQPSVRTARPRLDAIRLGPKSAAVIAAASVIGLALLSWPLWIASGPATSSGTGAAVSQPPDAVSIGLLAALLPLLVALVIATLSEHGMDTKALAMLGVLCAVDAALRPLGAGTGGVETVFFLLILAGRVFGPAFGFTLGALSLAVSALLTGGVGPWLPFQMLISAWIGLGAGLLPRRARGWREIVLLAVYGAVAGYAFGALMNLWFWPFLGGTAAGTTASIAYAPGAPLGADLGRFLLFSLVSSGAWDTVRAVTNVVLIAAVGPAVLALLRRAQRRAGFVPAVPEPAAPQPATPSQATSSQAAPATPLP
ncbi:MAG: ECF transporter S component [Bifidobacteriaceae bacterium]|jgi:energy-coupling factor transport system substrate-specific component|nr:ECF transporter S component [Bifidobacteriaceae bacterium]